MLLADLVIIKASGFSHFPVSLKPHLWRCSHNPLLLFSTEVQGLPGLGLRTLPSFLHTSPQRAHSFSNLITSLLFIARVRQLSVVKEAFTSAPPSPPTLTDACSCRAFFLPCFSLAKWLAFRFQGSCLPAGFTRPHPQPAVLSHLC